MNFQTIISICKIVTNIYSGFRLFQRETPSVVIIPRYCISEMQNQWTLHDTSSSLKIRNYLDVCSSFCVQSVRESISYPLNYLKHC